MTLFKFLLFFFSKTAGLLTSCVICSFSKDSNSEADAQANLAVDLAGKEYSPFQFGYILFNGIKETVHSYTSVIAEGQVMEDIER